MFLVYLFSEQYGRVAVLLAGLWAQSDEPEQEQRQTGAPDHQLPVIVILQECLVDVEQLKEDMFMWWGLFYYYFWKKKTADKFTEVRWTQSCHDSEKYLCTNAPFEKKSANF